MSLQKLHRSGLLRVALAFGLTAMHGCRGSEKREDREVVVYTSVDQVFSEPVFRLCEKETGLTVRAVFDTEETKSTGVLNRLIAEGNNPQADVFWSGDPVRPFVLSERGLLAPYVSKAAKGLPRAFRAEDGTWTGLAARARVFLVNTEKVKKEDTPRSIKDLTNPRWRGQAAIANPLFGTTTMHVAALFAAWGDDETKRFLASLKENEVIVASSNGEVKRLVVSGEVAFGLTDTDDAHQAVSRGGPVTVVYPDQDGMGTLLMPTTLVQIKNGPHRKAGHLLIDCLLGAEVERHMAKTAAHMPLREGVEAPKGVLRAQDVRVMAVDYQRVAETMVRIEPQMREWVGL